MNGFVHHYQLAETAVILGAFRSYFYSLSHFFSMQFTIKANRIAPDVAPRSGTSHLGLYCLPVFHKKDSCVLSEK